MATRTPHLLNLATTTTSIINLQIPTIAVKLDRENFIIWRTITIVVRETFELDELSLNPTPPPTTFLVPTIEGTPATSDYSTIPQTPTTIAPNLESTTWKKRDLFMLLWLSSTLSERALFIVTHFNSSYTGR